MAVQSPHILKAAPNLRRLESNLSRILDHSGREAIANEVCRNTRGLLGLSREHYDFAASVSRTNWRQKISRLYYASYHARRAVHLFVVGDYTTDSSDHKNVGGFPSDFPNRDTYKTRLADLRSDRNLADYDHEATGDDLIHSVEEATLLVLGLIDNAQIYLESKGLI
jgi:hypothetical protein